MKKKIAWLLVCSLLVGLAALSGCSGGAIRWKEPVVESAVRDYLGKAEGDIFPEDLAGITSIVLVGDDCSINQPPDVQTVSARTGDAILNVETGACRTSQGDSPSTLRTLADFAHFPDLEDLHLYDMSFSSLEGMDQLAKSESLRGLHLCFNSNLTSLKGLGKLDQLTTLRLMGLPVTDISELEKLTGLTMLELSDVPLESAEPLEELPLEMFFAGQAPAIDWQPVTDIDTLTRYDIQMLDGSSLDFTAE